MDKYITNYYLSKNFFFTKSEKRKILIEKIFSLIFTYVAICCILLLISTSISPLYPNHFSPIQVDTQIFQTIGRVILSPDKTLYIDIFDHKGPLLFYFYSFAYLTGGDISLLLIISLFSLIDLVLFRKILIKIYCSSMYLKNNKESKLSLSAVNITYYFGILIYLLMAVIELGRTDDFSLMLTLFSLNAVLSIKQKDWNINNINKEKSDKQKKFTLNNIYRFKLEPLYMFIIGIGIAIIFFMKFACLVAVACIGFCYIIYLIRVKEYKRLLFDVIFVLAGVLLISLPLVLISYFVGGKEYFSLMMDATFFINFRYVSSFNNGVGYRIICIIFGILLLIILPLMFVRISKILDSYTKLDLIIYGIFCIIYFFISKFIQYVVSVLPLLLFCLAYYLSLNRRNKMNFILNKAVTKLMISTSILASSIFIFDYYYDVNKSCNQFTSFLRENINEQDKDLLKDGKNILMFTGSYTYNISLYGNEIVPSYRLFTLQIWMESNFGLDFAKDLNRYLTSEERPKYLVFDLGKNQTNQPIENSFYYHFLEENNLDSQTNIGVFYSLVDTLEINNLIINDFDFQLYVRSDSLSVK